MQRFIVVQNVPAVAARGFSTTTDHTLSDNTPSAIVDHQRHDDVQWTASACVSSGGSRGTQFEEGKEETHVVT